MDPKTQRAIELTKSAYHAFENKNLVKARALLEEALSLTYGLPDTHNEYGLVLTRMNEFPKARKHFMQAIQMAPNNPKFWMSLAGWYLDQGDPHQALLLVDKIEGINPNYPTINVARMRIAHALGATESEINKYRGKALAIYMKTGKRADGTPLKDNDLDRI